MHRVGFNLIAITVLMPSPAVYAHAGEIYDAAVGKHRVMPDIQHALGADSP